MSFATPPHIRTISSFMLCSSVSLPTHVSLPALLSFLSPDIMSNHILSLSLQCSLSIHPSPPVSILSRSSLLYIAFSPSLLRGPASSLNSTVNSFKSDYVSWVRQRVPDLFPRTCITSYVLKRQKQSKQMGKQTKNVTCWLKPILHAWGLAHFPSLL